MTDFCFIMKEEEDGWDAMMMMQFDTILCSMLLLDRLSVLVLPATFLADVVG